MPVGVEKVRDRKVFLGCDLPPLPSFVFWPQLSGGRQRVSSVG
jgi:hypothetical protein